MGYPQANQQVYVITTGDRDDGYDVADLVIGPANADMDDLYKRFKTETNLKTDIAAHHKWLDDMKRKYGQTDYYANSANIFAVWLESHGFKRLDFETVDLGYFWNRD